MHLCNGVILFLYQNNANIIIMHVYYILLYSCKSNLRLNNLGNTCFMNAALQCLAHTPSLADFFLSKQFKNFVVEREQKIANAFADVIDKIYDADDSQNNSYYHSYYASYPVEPTHSPDEFLEAFTEDEVAPQFGGYRQRKFSKMSMLFYLSFLSLV